MKLPYMSNPCEPGEPLRVGQQVRVPLDGLRHAHGCVYLIVFGGAWVKLDNGEKVFVRKGELRAENPTKAQRTKRDREHVRRTRAAQKFVDALRMHQSKQVAPGVVLTRVEAYLFDLKTPNRIYRRLGADEAIETVREWL